MEEVEVRAAAPAAALAWTWTSQNTRNHLRNQLRIQVPPGLDLEKLRRDRPAVRASTTYISVLEEPACMCVCLRLCVLMSISVLELHLCGDVSHLVGISSAG